MKYFHVNAKVKVKICAFVSLFEPCKENGCVLGCFEEALFM